MQTDKFGRQNRRNRSNRLWLNACLFEDAHHSFTNLQVLSERGWNACSPGMVFMIL